MPFLEIGYFVWLCSHLFQVIFIEKSFRESRIHKKMYSLKIYDDYFSFQSVFSLSSR